MVGGKTESIEVLSCCESERAGREVEEEECRAELERDPCWLAEG